MLLMDRYFTDLQNGEVLRAAESIINSGQAVLLCGPPASGRTALLSYLASKLGAKPPIPLHLTTAQDTRDLIGSYVMTNKPGDFRFVLGPLAYAAQSGRWITIEEITTISQDSLLLLSSVLSTRTLSVGSYQISVHPDFRIHAKTSADSSVLSTVAKSMFYPLVLPPLGKHLFRVLTRHCFQGICTILAHVHFQFEAHRLTSGRVSASDMVKWARRIELDFRSGSAVLNKAVREAPSDTTATTLVSLLDDNARMVIVKNAWEAFILRYSKEQIREAFLDILRLALNIHEEFMLSTLLKIKVDIRHDYTQKRLVCGRISLSFYESPDERSLDSICRTNHTTRLLEIISSAIRANEPLLLVGPTGIGKTTCLQIVARALGKKLHVVNMSSQTDAADLLGGYVPATLDHILKSLYDAITGSFGLYISVKKNQTFVTELQRSYLEKDISKFLANCETALSGMKQVLKKEAKDVVEHAPTEEQIQHDKRRNKRGTYENSLYFLQSLEGTLEQATELHKILYQETEARKQTMAFKYQEGLLVQALVKGDWILIDEINLASYDLLDVISQLVNPEHHEIAIPDKGFVAKNPHFRVFAAMNPGSDVGKKDLPPTIRRCFTEVHVSEMSDDVDIVALTKSYLRMEDATIEDRQGLDPNVVYQLFTILKAKAKTELVTAAEAKCPCFSLRSLCRALSFAHRFRAAAGLRRSMYEGFMLAFGSMLSEKSRRVVHALLLDKLLNGNKEYLLNPFAIQPFNKPCTTMIFQAAGKEESVTVRYQDPPTAHGFLEEKKPQTLGADYVLTKSTRSYMTTISRAIAAQLPILLEGTTSSGKTSLIKHIAKQFGCPITRINNHEHTDLSEYFGSYQPDQLTGQLIFRDGPLVTGMKQGHWVILDELNMASSEILEALNRLLDDNKELLIPDTQEIVRPAPGFLLFATQNPSGSYAGRKMLSEAFQNRFIMIEFSDISMEELKEILSNRSTSRHLAPQYCEKLIATIQAIRMQLSHRNNNAVMTNALITLRDLFRVADRLPRTLSELAMGIFELIGERQRDPADKQLVAEIIAKSLGLKAFSIAVAEQEYAIRVRPIQNMIAQALKADGDGTNSTFLQKFQDIVWTPSMIRLFALLFTSISNGESPLLVGVSGAGKTTSVELVAAIMAQQLVQINLHKHTESADFIGSLRPLRSRESLHAHLSVLKEYAATNIDVDQAVYAEIKRVETTINTKLFEWEDGPILNCMKRGHILLLDEVSLADESVLERLNSVLETSRELTVAENPNMIRPVIAHTGFKLIATMNPAGDYGKKELSPAMRSRLTEFWMPHIRDLDEIRMILARKLQKTTICSLTTQQGLDIVTLLADFFAEMDRIAQSGRLGDVFTLSIRDILAVCDYVAEVQIKDGTELGQVLIDAVTLSILDGLPVRTQLGNMPVCREVKQEMILYLANRILSSSLMDIDSIPDLIVTSSKGTNELSFIQASTQTVLATIPPGPRYDHAKALQKMATFRLDAPTTIKNACRVAKALRFQRPILLEGDPGVGKSALVSAIAEICGYPLVRINLSEQTDLSDLLGSDLPSENGFRWVDGILLKAVKEGAFILLDELNLANQTVLEGLNSLLDHRRSLFIPELMLSVKAPNTLRIFGTQNPRSQGSGRKGLPQSFVNRFLNVYVDVLKSQDYDWILSNLFTNIPTYVLEYILESTKQLRAGLDGLQFGVSGGPWELNVRDMMRLCDMLTTTPSIAQSITLSHAQHYAHILFGYRFRTAADDTYVQNVLFSSQSPNKLNEVTQLHHGYLLRPLWNVTEDAVQIGSLIIPRIDPVFKDILGAKLSYSHPSCFLTAQLVALEALALAVTQNLSCILVGSPESGKSSILRTLADIARQPLIHISASTATDVSDLIGAYEQVDLLSDLKDTIRDLCLFVNSMPVKDSYSATSFSEFLKGLTTSLDREIGSGLGSKSQTVSVEVVVSEIVHKLLLEFITKFTPELDSSGLAAKNFSLFCSEILNQDDAPLDERLSPHMPTVHELCKSMSSLYLSAQQSQTGRFIWRDSELIRALERGYWVELTNANFCMPSVLDRLNSLLERGGGLEILEQGLDKTRSIKVHPNFRLFISYAPTSDISRALRNRSLELSVDIQVSRYNLIDIVRCVYTSSTASDVSLDPYLIKFVSLVYFELSRDNPEIVGLGSLFKWLKLLLTYHKRFSASTGDRRAVSSWLDRSFNSVFIASTLNTDLHQRYMQVYQNAQLALQGDETLDAHILVEAAAILNRLTLSAIRKLSINNSLQHSLALLELRTVTKPLDQLVSLADQEYHITEPFSQVATWLAICLGHSLDFQHHRELVSNLLSITDIDPVYLLAPPEPADQLLLKYVSRGYINTCSNTDSVMYQVIKYIAVQRPFYASLLNLFIEGKFTSGDPYLLLYLIELSQYLVSNSNNYDDVALFFSLFELLISYSIDPSTKTYSLSQRQTMKAFFDVILTDKYFESLPKLLSGYIRSLFISASRTDSEAAWLTVRRNLALARISVHYMPELFEVFRNVIEQLDLCVSPEGVVVLQEGLSDGVTAVLWKDIFATVIYMACRADNQANNYVPKIAVLQDSINRIEPRCTKLSNNQHPTALALDQMRSLFSLFTGKAFCMQVSDTLDSWSKGDVTTQLPILLFRTMDFYHKNVDGPITYLRGPIFSGTGDFIAKALSVPALLTSDVEKQAISTLKSLLCKSEDLLSYIGNVINSIVTIVVRLFFTALGQEIPSYDFTDGSMQFFTYILETVIHTNNSLLASLIHGVADLLKVSKSIPSPSNPLLLQGLVLIVASLVLYLLTSVANQRDPMVVAKYRGALYRRLAKLIASSIDDSKLHALFVFGDSELSGNSSIHKELSTLYNSYAEAADRHEAELLVRADDEDNTFFEDLSSQLASLDGFELHVLNFVLGVLNLEATLQTQEDLECIEAAFDGLVVAEYQMSSTLAALLPRLINYTVENSYYLDMTVPIASLLMSLRVGLSATVSCMYAHVCDVTTAAQKLSTEGTRLQLTFQDLLLTVQRVVIGTGDEFLDLLCYDKFLRSCCSLGTFSTAHASRLFTLSLLQYASCTKGIQSDASQFLLTSVLKPERVSSIAAQFEIEEARSYRKYIEDHSIFKTRNQSSTAEGVDEEDELKSQIAALFPKNDSHFVRSDTPLDNEQSASVSSRAKPDYDDTYATSFLTRMNMILIIGSCILYSYTSNIKAAPIQERLHSLSSILQGQVPHPSRPLVAFQAATHASSICAGSISSNLSIRFPLTLETDRAMYTLVTGATMGLIQVLSSRSPNVDYAKLQTGKTRRALHCKDIYNHPYPYETAEFCSTLLRKIIARTRHLLTEWPDNIQLLDIMHVCSKLMELPVLEAPLVMFLTGAEVLVRHLETWDKGAPTVYKYVTNPNVPVPESLTKALTHLMVMWRRIELMSWNGFFSRIHTQFSNVSLTYWPELLIASLAHQRSVIQGEPSTEAYYKQVREFLYESNIGEFPVRLSLLHTLSALISDLDELVEPGLISSMHKTKTSAVLFSIASEAGEFANHMVKEFEVETAQIKKRFEDQIRIFEWNERSSYTSWLTAQNSHRLCTKIIREYTEVLQHATRASHMGYNATFDRIPLSITIQEYLPLNSQSGMLTTTLSNELVGRLNYCIEKMRYGRKESETLKRNEKNRILSDVLEVLKETLGCVLSTGFSFEQSSGWKLAQLCLPSAHSAFELISMFNDSLYQRCNEVEPHDIERMKRIVTCFNQILVQLSELFVELSDIELLYKVIGAVPTNSTPSQANTKLYIYLADKSIPQLLITQVTSHVATAHKMCMALQEFLGGLPPDSCKSSPTKLHERISAFLERFSSDSMAALNRIKTFSKFSMLVEHLGSVTLISLSFFEEIKGILQRITKELSPIFSALETVLPGAPVSVFVTEHKRYFAQVTEVINTLTEQLSQCELEDAAIIPSVEWPYLILPFIADSEDNFSVEHLIHHTRSQVSTYMDTFSIAVFQPILQRATCRVVSLPILPSELLYQIETIKSDTRALADVLANFMRPLISGAIALLRTGFHSQVDNDQNEVENDNQSGLGLGDGTGEQNVSKEAAKELCEDDLMGNQNDRDQNEQHEEDKDDEAIDMQNDFGGMSESMHRDIEEEDSENQDEEEMLEKEMGSDQGEAIDERNYNKDDDTAEEYSDDQKKNTNDNKDTMELAAQEKDQNSINSEMSDPSGEHHEDQADTASSTDEQVQEDDYKDLDDKNLSGQSELSTPEPGEENEEVNGELEEEQQQVSDISDPDQDARATEEIDDKDLPSSDENAEERDEHEAPVDVDDSEASAEQSTVNDEEQDPINISAQQQMADNDEMQKDTEYDQENTTDNNPDANEVGANDKKQTQEDSDQFRRENAEDQWEAEDTENSQGEGAESAELKEGNPDMSLEEFQRIWKERMSIRDRETKKDEAAEPQDMPLQSNKTVEFDDSKTGRDGALGLTESKHKNITNQEFDNPNEERSVEQKSSCDEASQPSDNRPPAERLDPEVSDEEEDSTASDHQDQGTLSHMRESSKDLINCETELQQGSATSLTCEEIKQAPEDMATAIARGQHLLVDLIKQTSAAAFSLAERLRIILEPTITSDLKGDFRTGKKLNLRRIIPFIASEFRKDKIWLRRTKPNKRVYQVLLAVDDSSSMAPIAKYALQAITLLFNACKFLEVGQLSVFSFGKRFEILLPITDQYNDASLAHAIGSFTFAQDETRISDAISVASDYLDSVRFLNGSDSALQLLLMISDGRIKEKSGVAREIRKCMGRGQLPVLIVLDTGEKSIMDIKSVNFVTDSSGRRVAQTSMYLDDFPFQCYALLRHIEDLPETLVAVIKRWIESVSVYNAV